MPQHQGITQWPPPLPWAVAPGAQLKQALLLAMFCTALLVAPLDRLATHAFVSMVCWFELPVIVTSPRLDDRFWLAYASAPVALLLTMPPKLAIVWVELPLIVTLPELLARFWMASLRAPDEVLLTLVKVRFADWVELPEI